MQNYKALWFCFNLFLFLIFLNPAFSQTKPTVHDLNEIQQTLDKEKGKLKSYEHDVANLLDELERINKEIDTRADEIKAYIRQLHEIEASTEQLEQDIEVLSEELKSKQDKYKERIVQLYKHSKGQNLSLLITSEDSTDLIKRARYLDYLVRYDSDVIETYSKRREALIAKKENLKEQHQLMEIVKKQLETKHIILLNEKDKKNKLLKKVQSEKSIQEKLVSNIEASTLQLFEELINKQQEATSKTNEVEKEFEKSASRKTKKIKKKVPYFEKLKGKLPWPVEGKMISSTGTQGDAIYNIPLLKNGVLIEAEFGQLVHTVGKGVVVFADWFKGYGKLFIINHGGGYHTLYGQLSDIFLKPGDRLEAHQEIGRVGESGTLNKTGLYFEIRYRGKPQDPAIWLAKK